MLIRWVTLSLPVYLVPQPVLSAFQGLAHSTPITAMGQEGFAALFISQERNGSTHALPQMPKESDRSGK